MRIAMALLSGVLALAACGGGSGGPSPVSPGPSIRPRVLIVTHTAGFRHDSIPTAEAVLQEIATSSAAFDVEYCRTSSDVSRLLTTEGLAPFAAVVFANTTGNLGIPDMSRFLDWIRSGRAFIGVHSASDTYHDDTQFLDMLGGEFLEHGAIVSAEVEVLSATHASVSHLAPRFTVEDEFYRFTRFQRDGVNVLLALRRNPADGVGVSGAPVDLPLSWTRAFGSGRVFYSALGHRQELWRDVGFRQHLLGAIRSVLPPS